MSALDSRLHNWVNIQITIYCVDKPVTNANGPNHKQEMICALRFCIDIGGRSKISGPLSVLKKKHTHSLSSLGIILVNFDQISYTYMTYGRLLDSKLHCVPGKDT